MEEIMPELRPLQYGYCNKCIHNGLKATEMWCYKYGKSAKDIHFCDYFDEQLNKDLIIG